MKPYAKKQISRIRRGKILVFIILFVTAVVVTFIQHQLYSYNPLLKNNLWFQFGILVLTLSPTIWLFTSNNKEFTDLLKIESYWVSGEKGEDEVYQHLKHLGPDYKILRKVQPSIFSRDIDLVVIGKNGIAAIEVKNRSTLNSLISNYDVDVVNARKEAALINNLIRHELNRNYTVLPFLVFAGKFRSYKNKPVYENRVLTTVVGSDNLSDAIREQHGIYLSPKMVNRINSQLSKYSTSKSG